MDLYTLSSNQAILTNKKDNQLLYFAIEKGLYQVKQQHNNVIHVGPISIKHLQGSCIFRLELPRFKKSTGKSQEKRVDNKWQGSL